MVLQVPVLQVVRGWGLFGLKAQQNEPKKMGMLLRPLPKPLGCNLRLLIKQNQEKLPLRKRIRRKLRPLLMAWLALTTWCPDVSMVSKSGRVANKSNKVGGIIGLVPFAKPPSIVYPQVASRAAKDGMSNPDILMLRSNLSSLAKLKKKKSFDPQNFCPKKNGVGLVPSLPAMKGYLLWLTWIVKGPSSFIVLKNILMRRPLPSITKASKVDPMREVLKLRLARLRPSERMLTRDMKKKLQSIPAMALLQILFFCSPWYYGWANLQR